LAYIGPDLISRQQVWNFFIIGWQFIMINIQTYQM
jgi:hypothetical protein